MQISKCDVKFDFILGQDPILSKDNNLKQLKTLKKQGQIKYIIGDKTDDIKPAKEIGAEYILVTWGHMIGNEKKIADYIISDGKSILKIIK